jgi:hypothetical protein
MTEHGDLAGVAFERALQQHASDAPGVDGLIERVQERVSRRRRNRRWLGAGVLSAAAVASIVAVAPWLAGGAPDKQSEPAPVSTSPTTPDGWRWESSRGVQLLAPDTWVDSRTYGNMCLAADDEHAAAEMLQPYVGRATDSSEQWASPREICRRIQDRVPFVWFDDYRARPGIRDHGHGWAEETRVVAGVTVTVFSDDDAIRRTVMDSLGPVDDVDAFGCSANHPIGEHPDTRPAPGGGLATVGAVTSISVCSYTSHQLTEDDLPPLLASSRLTGADAQQLVDAILAAPLGSGPNGHDTFQAGVVTLEGCRQATGAHQWPEGPYGYQKILLIVHGSERSQEVVVRFDGCNYHGTDDGVAQRQLTADVLRPLLARNGPNQPYYGLSTPISDLLFPRP